jgi:hypothetical protein
MHSYHIKDSAYNFNTSLPRITIVVISKTLGQKYLSVVDVRMATLRTSKENKYEETTLFKKLCTFNSFHLSSCTLLINGDILNSTINGHEYLTGKFLTELLTCKRKNPQIEGGKIANQQDYEGRNPKNLFFKNSKVTRV